MFVFLFLRSARNWRRHLAIVSTTFTHIRVWKKKFGLHKKNGNWFLAVVKRRWYARVTTKVRENVLFLNVCGTNIFVMLRQTIASMSDKIVYHIITISVVENSEMRRKRIGSKLYRLRTINIRQKTKERHIQFLVQQVRSSAESKSIRRKGGKIHTNVPYTCG